MGEDGVRESRRAIALIGHLTDSLNFQILGASIVCYPDPRFSNLTRLTGTVRGHITWAPEADLQQMEIAQIHGRGRE